MHIFYLEQFSEQFQNIHFFCNEFLSNCLKLADYITGSNALNVLPRFIHRLSWQHCVISSYLECQAASFDCSLKCHIKAPPSTEGAHEATQGEGRDGSLVRKG